jgi:hypothetical protein
MVDELLQEINDIRDCIQSAAKPGYPSLLLILSPDDDKSITSSMSSKPSFAGAVHKVFNKIL